MSLANSQGTNKCCKFRALKFLEQTTEVLYWCESKYLYICIHVYVFYIHSSHIFFIFSYYKLINYHCVDIITHLARQQPCCGEQVVNFILEFRIKTERKIHSTKQKKECS